MTRFSHQIQAGFERQSQGGFERQSQGGFFASASPRTLKPYGYQTHRNGLGFCNPVPLYRDAYRKLYRWFCLKISGLGVLYRCTAPFPHICTHAHAHTAQSGTCGTAVHAYYLFIIFFLYQRDKERRSCTAVCTSVGGGRGTLEKPIKYWGYIDG